MYDIICLIPLTLRFAQSTGYIAPKPTIIQTGNGSNAYDSPSQTWLEKDPSNKQILLTENFS